MHLRKFSKLFLLSIGLFLFVSTFDFGAIPANERAALIALYNSTNGDNWTNNTGWKTPPLHTDGFAMPGTEGAWYGVSISNNHVVRLSFSQNLLTGTIPTEIGNLTELTELYLTLNRISGTIPSELGNLTKLTLLHLKNNRLTGSIPPQFGNLSNLQYLAMQFNQLSGNLPSQLGNLNKLEIINLWNNQLTGPIPPELGNLSLLNTLKLNENKLSGSIPPELGNLNLQFLLLDNNQLSGEIPSALTNIPHLIGFTIDNNCLYSTNLTLRTWLNKYDPDWELSQPCHTITITSPLGGETWEQGTTHPITWTFGSAIENVKIEYSTNEGLDWTTITPSTPNTGSYSWLVPQVDSDQCMIKISGTSQGNKSDVTNYPFSIIPNTTLTVTFPHPGEALPQGSSQTITWIAPPSIPNVKIEYSSDNGSNWFEITSSTGNNGTFDWTVPSISSTQCLVRISSIDETHTDTTDSTFSIYNGIPICKRDILIKLYNSTDGDNWTDKTGWKTPPLYSDGFAMPGTESTWYGIDIESNNLIGINLSNNNLNGVIPTEIGNLDDIFYLILSLNQLHGCIPSELGNMTNLGELNLSGNYLIDPIPTELGNLTNLTGLHLQYNRLSGTIPPEIGNLTGLTYLELGDNQLRGEIPATLTNLTNLDIPFGFDISDNCLYATDTALQTWLGQINPNWENYQKNCGVISVISPNGGEAWQTGSNNKISFIATDDITSIKVEYSKDNGATWATITNSLVYPYTTTWTTPDTGSYQCKTRATSNIPGTHIYAESDKPFTIYNGISTVERSQLIELYNATNGDKWLNKENWKDWPLYPLHLDGFSLPGSEISWYGITIQNNHVTGIQLANNHLTGSIPDETGSLTSLQALQLNSNKLSGPIPSSIQNLTNLTSLDLGYNALYTTDDALKTFLDSKDSDWANTQTIAPSNVTAKTISQNCIEISWTPILYKSDSGGYRIYISDIPGGPYTLAGTTNHKNTSSFFVTGLNPSKTYYFVVQSFTNPHANNPNSVESQLSPEVSATTLLFSQITVTSPTGSENFKMGSSIDIIWQATGISKVKIELLKGNSSFQTIASDVLANQGTYSFNIPERITGGTNYRIKISSIDTGVHINHTSNTFSITPNASLVLNAPNGNESWQVNHTYTITWGTSGIENLKIELFKGTSLYTVITETTPAGPGKYLWTIPADQPLASDYTIKISSVDAGINLNDTSEEVFNIIAAKRVSSDFNADGKTDILWRYYGSSGSNCVWITGNENASSAIESPLLDSRAISIRSEADTENKITGTGDFNSDGKEDILWHNHTTGTNTVWFMDGTTYSSETTIQSESSTSWDIRSTADFNHDGTPDILWRNIETGNNKIKLMNGTITTEEILLPSETDLTWNIFGTGDFNGDGKTDILWHNSTTGIIRIWLMNGTSFLESEVLPAVNTDWEIVGAGDYDGNGTCDIFWRNKINGRNTVWLMEGLTRNSALPLTQVTNTDWMIEN